MFQNWLPYYNDKKYSEIHIKDLNMVARGEVKDNVII
jgi:hypothetical protein